MYGFGGKVCLWAYGFWAYNFGRMVAGLWFWMYGLALGVCFGAYGFGRKVLRSWFWVYGLGRMV